MKVCGADWNEVMFEKASLAKEGQTLPGAIKLISGISSGG
jgi:hypothetical protein